MKSFLQILKPGKRIILFLILFSSFRISAADYYWVGGTGNWSDISHWATTTGGSTMHFTVPTATDDVHFDANSFNSSGQTVTVNTNAVCRDIDWTGATYNPGFSCSSSYSLRIYGSVTLISAMTFTMSGNVYFEATSTGKTLTSAGRIFNTIYFQGIGGCWTLQDSLTANSTIYLYNGSVNTNSKKVKCGAFYSDDTTSRTLNISNSIFQVSDWRINGTHLNFNSNASHIIIIGNEFHHSGTPQIYNNISHTGSYLRFEGGKSDFNIIKSNFVYEIEGANKIDSVIVYKHLRYLLSNDSINYIYANILSVGGISIGSHNYIKKAIIENTTSYSSNIGSNNNIDSLFISGNAYLDYNKNIKFLSVDGYANINYKSTTSNKSTFGKVILYGNGDIGGNNIFDTLTFSPGKIYTLEKNDTQYINYTLLVNGKCISYILIQSSLTGSKSYISKSAGTITGNYLIIRDNGAIGGASYTANNSVNVSNNSGWSFNSPSPADLFWVGGSGNWSDSTHWATSSGGMGGSCLPSPFDNVHFDSNSFSAANQLVTLTTNYASCNNMDWSGSRFSPGFSCSTGNSLHVFGSLTLISAMTFTMSGSVYFEATSTGKTLTSAGRIFNTIYFQGIGGCWTLQDSLTANSTIYLYNGSVNTNSKKVKCGAFYSDDTTSRTLNISNSIFQVSDWRINGTHLNFNSNASHIIITGNEFHHSGTPQIYNNISHTGSGLRFEGGKSDFNIIKSNFVYEIEGANKIDSVIVYKHLRYLLSNDSINYIYAKISSVGGISIGSHNYIKKAIIENTTSYSSTIVGNNNIDSLFISGNAYLDYNKNIKFLSVDGYANINYKSTTSNNSTFGKVILYDNGDIGGNNIFDTLTFSPGKIYTLEKNDIQYITNHFGVRGNNCYPLSIRSDAIGYLATISKPTGKVISDFLELRDIEATGGATFYAGSHSSNLGNNPGWNFSNAPGYIYGLGNDTSLCKGAVLSTENFNGGQSFLWQDSSTNPYFKVIKPGSYWVKASFGLGCAYTDTITILGLKPNPVAGFVTNSNIQCLTGNSFQFSDTSSIDSGSIISYKWDYGDGKSDTLQNPSHNYNFADTFNIKMVAVSDLGCMDSMQKSLYVYDPPQSGFSINVSSQCFSGNNFVFNNKTLNPPKSTTTYTWNFGDGTQDTATNTNHSYTKSDTFLVSLLSLSNLGCKDSVINQVIVFPSGITSLSINDTSQCLSGNKYIFKTNTPNDTAWTWNTGDGNIYHTDSFTHTYLASDTFTILFYSFSANGCKDSIQKNVVVLPNPKATFLTNDNSQCLKGNSFTFNPGSPLVMVSGYQWNFGDGTNSIMDTVTHSYLLVDTFQVSLKVTSMDGCTDSISYIVQTNPMPLADFVIWDSSQCLERNDFGFANKSKILYGSLSYLWNFGDTVTSIQVNPHHQYAYADTFTVKIKVTSQEGCTDSFEKHTFLHVHPEPLAEYLINDSIQCLSGNKFNFTNGSSIKSGTFKQFWDFNDGSISDSLNTSHSYTTFDTFTTKLLIVSDWACKDSILKKVYLNPMPKADYTINLNPQTLGGNNFQFTNQTNIPYGNLTYNWDFGDGATSAGINGSHIYSLPDTFNVKLTSVSDAGCPDSFIQKVYVLLFVSVDFIANRFCLGDTVHFESICNALPDSFKNFTWDFGDGNTINIRNNPRHFYTDTGTYNVTMIGFTYLGYRDTVTKSITILPKPSLSITYNKDTAFYPGGSSILTANGTFDSIFWSTGQTTTDIIVKQEGKYSVRVVGYNGCDAIDSIRIYLLEMIPFNAVNVITPNDDGINDVWKVKNIEQYQPCKVKIFNRWGDELYSSDNYQNDWNGTYKGKKLPEGTYYYVFETMDGVIYMGAINIFK